MGLNSELPIQNCGVPCNSSAERLNSGCFCITLNREKLNDILQNDDLHQNVLATHPTLFSNTAVFISPMHLQKMRDIIHAVTRVVNLPAYAQKVLARAPAIAAYNPGPLGVFMGYDFHLDAEVPKIIEINTNAGGAFVNAALVSAQIECCRATGMLLPEIKTSIEEEFMAMFLKEWQLQRGDKKMTTIAIVDNNPEQQFLYPEFEMAQRLFERKGITAIISDPSELHLIDHALCIERDGNKFTVDLVYNRLTDFLLSDPDHAVLRRAYEHNNVVVTPSPGHHALYADKRNLVELSDSENLKQLGATDKDIDILQKGIPQTRNVTAENADELWATRKQLFFKPALGFGSRAAYRGDKLTKRVWNDILQADSHKGDSIRSSYVAQQLVVPSERGILVDGIEAALKMDIRAYVYDGEIQLLAARLYQGQTTNFRTQGGGFAPVFIGS
jgi:hypothetical protein